MVLDGGVAEHDIQWVPKLIPRDDLQHRLSRAGFDLDARWCDQCAGIEAAPTACHWLHPHRDPGQACGNLAQSTPLNAIPDL